MTTKSNFLKKTHKLPEKLCLSIIVSEIEGVALRSDKVRIGARSLRVNEGL